MVIVYSYNADKGLMSKNGYFKLIGSEFEWVNESDDFDDSDDYNINS